jgi:hypothetical protein
MLELMDEEMPSLAVHDSIIVPISKRHVASSVLSKQYERFAKAKPVLIEHFPEGYVQPYNDDPLDFS